MAESHRISVEFTSEQMAFLNQAVETGEYATTGEIIHEALRQWRWNREFSPDEIVRLRELCEEGEASGPAEPIDFDQLRREARERLQQRQMAQAANSAR